MLTSSSMVLGVVVPTSAAGLLLMLLRSRCGAASRLGLGAAGLCLAAAGVTAVQGVTASASGPSSDERMWVVTAGADPGTGTRGSAATPVLLPYAPFTLYGVGIDQPGTYRLVADLPGAADVTVLDGAWPTGGRARRALALLDPAAIAAAAAAQGILPEDGAYSLELVTADPRVRLHLTLPGAPPVKVTVPTGLIPQPAPGSPVTGPVSSAARAPATGSAAAPGPAVGVPSTGGGAVAAGLGMLLAGAGCAVASLRWRRTPSA